jgi:hypothetical protein
MVHQPSTLYSVATNIFVTQPTEDSALQLVTYFADSPLSLRSLTILVQSRRLRLAGHVARTGSLEIRRKCCSGNHNGRDYF